MTTGQSNDTGLSGRDWVRVLAQYREGTPLRSSYELGISLLIFFSLWAFALSLSGTLPMASLAIAVINGLFLVRIFAIQHDCGHAAFFSNRKVNDWIGRALGVLTLTPYDVWKRTHSMHHSAAGHLDKRGIGDVQTLTVKEYRDLSALRRLQYRLYRNPLVLFGLGPVWIFFIQNRLPIGWSWRGRWR